MITKQIVSAKKLVYKTVLVSTLACIFSANTAYSKTSDDTLIFRYSSPLGESSALMATSKLFMEEVESRTDGRVKFKVFWGGALMGGTETVPSINNGIIDAGFSSDPYWPDLYPLWNVIGIPFETTDPYAVSLAFYNLSREDGPFSKEIADSGVFNLFYIPYSTTIVGTLKPISSIEDLESLRVRAIGHLATAYELAEARPTAMDPVEVYEAIDRGVVDGYGGWPFASVPDAGFHEVAPYTSSPGIGHYASASFAFSKSKWEKLPEDIKNIMIDVAHEIQTKDSIRMTMEQEEIACNIFEEEQIKILVWDESEVRKWKNLAHDEIYQHWRKSSIERGVHPEEVDKFYERFHSEYRKALSSSTYVDGLKQCAQRIN